MPQVGECFQYTLKSAQRGCLKLRLLHMSKYLRKLSVSNPGFPHSDLKQIGDHPTIQKLAAMEGGSLTTAHDAKQKQGF
eukprot:3104213-Amphidinium_carterae.1